jgi:hypothetical protein
MSFYDDAMDIIFEGLPESRMIFDRRPDRINNPFSSEYEKPHR